MEMMDFNFRRESKYEFMKKAFRMSVIKALLFILLTLVACILAAAPWPTMSRWISTAAYLIPFGMCAIMTYHNVSRAWRLKKSMAQALIEEVHDR